MIETEFKANGANEMSTLGILVTAGGVVSLLLTWMFNSVYSGYRGHPFIFLAIGVVTGVSAVAIAWGPSDALKQLGHYNLSLLAVAATVAVALIIQIATAAYRYRPVW